MFWKRKNLLKTLKLRSFLESSWITNFWIIDDDLYLTNALVQQLTSSVCKIPIKILKENLAIKEDYERTFIASPVFGENLNLDIDKTDVELLEIKDGYVNKIVKKDDQILVSTINEKPKSEQFIKIVQIENESVYLTDQNQIIYYDRVIYQSDKALNIANFGVKGLLVSDQATKELFYLIGENFVEKHLLYTGNYYYRLDCYQQNIIIGKPLFDDFGDINYYLPLHFIY